MTAKLLLKSAHVNKKTNIQYPHGISNIQGKNVSALLGQYQKLIVFMCFAFPSSVGYSLLDIGYSRLFLCLLPFLPPLDIPCWILDIQGCFYVFRLSSLSWIFSRSSGIPRLRDGYWIFKLSPHYCSFGSLPGVTTQRLNYEPFSIFRLFKPVQAFLCAAPLADKSLCHAFGG